MPLSTADPYDGASGSFPVRVQEVAVALDRHAPQGADQRLSDPARESARQSGGQSGAQSGDTGADHLTGRVLDNRYLIGSRVARGGMATVYEATDLRLDRTVAVKVMHPGLGHEPRRELVVVAQPRVHHLSLIHI